MRLLFRRVMKRLRRQEWMAIGIDFLIVVIGVFVATQVSNWNDAAADRRHARELTQALHAEFTDIEGELETSLANITRYQAASRSLVTALRNDTLPPDDNQVKGWILTWSIWVGNRRDRPSTCRWCPRAICN
ncbi:MAG: hypothetical protein HZY74_04600 [Brevundimonas sp.]|nr:MAG: hypothetical protein HZY74_04600 [Brevundimonas sp.]